MYGHIKQISGLQITKWRDGNHYYISKNGTPIEIENQSKWNTAKAAEAAIKRYKNKNIFDPDS